MGFDSITTGEAPHPVIVKRSLNKRRAFIPTAAAAPSSTSACSAEESVITDEEEDMANCLILLAKGSTSKDSSGEAVKATSRMFADAETTTSGRAGFYVYECKTCNKSFSSFQALGGHRTSHKKHKMSPTEPAPSVEENRGVVNDSGVLISMNSFSKTAKVHECSICGSEFSSGQALGGHMRRHRPAVLAEEVTDQRKEKNVLSLDLNLPAVAEERNNFALVGKPLVFSPLLDDCNY